jgi:hypothetical protein
MARNRKGKIVRRKRVLSTRIKRKHWYRKKKKKKKRYLIIFWRSIDMHHVCLQFISTLR